MPVQVIDSLEANWKPQSWPQMAALQSNVGMLLYGGAAGSLKSETEIVDAIRHRDNPNGSTILFRRTNPELGQLIMRSHEIYSQCGATFNSQQKIWKFPSGMRMRFGWAKRDEDIFQYQGDEYDTVSFDESTHHTEFRIRYMISRLRSTDPTLQSRLRVRLATNPGNVGHQFHKHLFIGPTCPHCKLVKGSRIPGKIYNDATWLTDKKPVGMTTSFIPGSLQDHNLLGKDYEEKNLANLPGFYAMALRLGCWEMFEGQYFDIWDEDKMTIGKRELDMLRKPWWPLWTGGDYGFGESGNQGSAAASYLFTLEPPSKKFPRGRTFICDEYFAQRVLAENYAIEQKLLWHGPGQRPEPNYLSPDCWNKKGDGKTLAIQMQEATGISYEMASNDRVGGAMLMYTMLAKGELVICRETCPRLIKTIPSRIHDKDRPEDVLKVKGEPEDDCYDGARYGVYSYVTHGKMPKESAIEEAVTSQDPTIQAIQRRQAEANLGREDEAVSFSQYGDFRKIRGY